MLKIPLIPRGRPVVYIILIILMIGLFYLIRNVHKNTPFNSWENHLYADPGGYFAYLPLTYYGWDYSKVPDDIQSRIGRSIQQNDRGKIALKYTCGVALMQAPFYFGIALGTSLDPPEDAFAGPYRMTPILAASFWFVLGIWWLFLFLRHYYKPRFCLLAILLLTLGTNTIHYLVMEPGFSHIYSFSLVCALLLTTKKLIDKATPQYWRFALWSLIMAMITLIRPTNLVFVLVVFLDVRGFKEIGFRLRTFFTLERILIGLAVGVLVMSPQLFYWKYSSDSWIRYSYGSETFDNWLNPAFLTVLFAPKNGLFLYSPIYLIILPALAWFVIRKKQNALIVASLFAIILYLTASWHMPTFGCSYGMRNMVDLAPFMAIPLGLLLSRLKNWKTIIPVGFLLITTTAINLQLIRNYTRCFLCDDTWDWAEYQFFLTRNSMNVHLSFEDEGPYNVIDEHASDGQKALELKPGEGFDSPVVIKQGDHTNAYFRRAFCELFVKGKKPANGSVDFVLFQKEGAEVVTYNTFVLLPYLASGDWKHAQQKFYLQKHTSSNATYHLRFLNNSNETVMIDGFKLQLH